MGTVPGDQEDQRPPQALADPGFDPQQVSQSEDRTHREEIAVGLVLQLARCPEGIPQAQATGQEGRGVDLQVELGVTGDPPRALDEGEDDEEERHHPPVRPPPPPIRRIGEGHCGPRRSTITAFHDTTSRSPGTAATQCAQLGW